MEQPQLPIREMVFALPLRWPANPQERIAYERSLVEYARLMTPLLEASEASAAEEVLNVLKPFLHDIECLWPAGEVPAAIREMLQVFRKRSTEVVGSSWERK